MERTTDLAAGLAMLILTVVLMLHNMFVSVGVFRTAKINAPFILIGAQVCHKSVW